MKKIKLDKKKHKKVISMFKTVNEKKNAAKEAKAFSDIKVEEFLECSNEAWKVSYTVFKKLDPKKLWIYNHIDLCFEELPKTKVTTKEKK